MPHRYLITAGLPYSNGQLHLGHIGGAYLPADIFNRYCKLRGRSTLFICGTDDHGVAALMAARGSSQTVEELTQANHAAQKQNFIDLGIEFDIFGGTHHPDFYDIHRQLSQEFFTHIFEAGYFSKKTTPQLYDAEAKQFLPDRFVKGRCYHKLEDGSECGFESAHGDQCDGCGQTIDALKLINPLSTITGKTPRSERHHPLVSSPRKPRRKVTPLAGAEKRAFC